MSLATVLPRDGQRLSALVPRSREVWVAADGSGRIRETAGEPIFLGQRDRERWHAAGSPTFAPATNRDFAAGGLSARRDAFQTLPTDPDALARIIRERATRTGGPPVDVEMFVIVGDLLRETAAPPALRAALYTGATRISGVELLSDATDRAGRRGVGVALTTDHFGGRQRLLYVFDPATHALLGEERTLLERVDWIDAAPPAGIGYTVYLASATVPSLP